LLCLKLDLRTDSEGGSSLLVTFENPQAAADHAAGREIGPGKNLHDFIDPRIGIFDEELDGTGDLGQVVRWDARRHPYRNALRSVHQQVREAGGKNDRLFVALVVG